MNSITIRKLSDGDKKSVLKLMKTDHLRLEGVLDPGTGYWGAIEDGRLIGIIGCEYEGTCGLLRSAMVDHAYRGRGIGTLLTNAVLDDAAARKLDSVYLFSTGAGAYWQRLGFLPISVQEVVNRLSHAPQVMLFENLGWLPDEAAYKKEITET